MLQKGRAVGRPCRPASPTSIASRGVSRRPGAASIGARPTYGRTQHFFRIALCQGRCIRPAGESEGEADASTPYSAGPRWIWLGPAPAVFSYLPSPVFSYLVKPRRSRFELLRSTLSPIRAGVLGGWSTRRTGRCGSRTGC